MKQERDDDLHGLINYFFKAANKSAEYPYNILTRYRFICEENSYDFTLFLTLETSLFNLLPDVAFKWIIKKGVRRAGFDIKLNFITPKELILKENFGIE